MAELFFDIEKSNRDRDKDFAEVEKFNPYHGADGRFTSGSGATSFTYKPGASKAHDAAISREKGKPIQHPHPTTGQTSSFSESKLPKGLSGADLAYIGTPKVSMKDAASLLHATGWTHADRDAIEMEFNLTPDYTDKLVAAMKKQEGSKYKTAKQKPSDGELERRIKEHENRVKSGKKNQPEGDRAISDRKGGEIMDDIGTHKVSTSSTISALKQAGFKKKDIKQIQRQYDLSDAQAKEISDNWSKYH